MLLKAHASQPTARVSEAVALLEVGAQTREPQTLAGKLKQSALPQSIFLHFLHLLPPFRLPEITPRPTPLSITLLAAQAAMSPFQNSHQPTHAGQPAGALNFAPDEEPIASSFDGAGPPLDFTFMEAPGFWNHEFASQNAGLNDPWMMPSFNAEGPFFDNIWNYQVDENFGLGTAASSQSALGPGLDEQMMLPPFNSTLWMDQPLGQVASTSALFPGQAPIAAQSHLQDASFDLYQADWTNHGAGMPDALDPFADDVR
jgi:hypothetical protein